jgi:hypothetical protein
MRVWQSKPARGSPRVRRSGGKMAMRGVHFAISDATLAYIAGMDSPDSVVELIANVIEEGWPESRYCETDKSWGLIHCTMQGSNPCADSLDRMRDHPSSWAILGRVYLRSPDDYLIGLVRQPDVVSVVEAMEAISEAEFSERLSNLIAQHKCEYIGPKLITDAATRFVSLRDFYRGAAASGLNVIFTVDW